MIRNTLALLCFLAGPLLLAPPARAQPAPPRVLSSLDVLKGGEDVELRWPVAVASSSADEIVVADAFGPRLLRFRKVGVSWQPDKTVTLGGAPVSLVWDGRRYVAGLREGQGLVAFEGSDLAQRAHPFPRAVVPGPMSVYPGGDLLVYDYAGGRALRLSSDGTTSSEVAIPGEVTALAVAPSGGFYAAVASQEAVLHFDAGGGLQATWRLPPFEEIPAWPAGLAVVPGGDLLVVDRHVGRVLVLDTSGEVVGVGARQGWEPGLLLFPAGVTVLSDGLVLVADQGNGRAQLFRRTD